jgi:hypothetical protein
MGTVSFDFGGRIAEHVEYSTEAQFTLAAARLAERAAIEAQRLAGMFQSLGDTATILLLEAQTEGEQPHLPPGWADYNAGVAAALVGRSHHAAEMFARILNSPAPPGSLLHPAAERMSRLVTKPLSLRQEVITLIERQRQALRLSPLNAPPF